MARKSTKTVTQEDTSKAEQLESKSAAKPRGKRSKKSPENDKNTDIPQSEEISAQDEKDKKNQPKGSRRGKAAKSASSDKKNAGLSEQQIIYMGKIKPLIYRIYSYCNTYGIPFFAAFGFDEWDRDAKIGMADMQDDEDDFDLTDDGSESESGMAIESNILDLPLDRISKMARGEVLMADGLLPQVVEAGHFDKRFARFINVVNGFDTIYKEHGNDFDLSDIVMDGDDDGDYE